MAKKKTEPKSPNSKSPNKSQAKAQEKQAAALQESESTLKRWLKDNRITEVECLVPDITGNARGKIIPAAKFSHDYGTRLPEGIFVVAIQYAFTGFAALAPLLLAALFWRGSTKWGALASTLWVALGVVGIAALNAAVPAPPPGQATAVWTFAGQRLLERTAGGISVLGLLPVVPMVLISALLMLVVSALTPKPSPETIARYFPPGG